MKRLSGFRFYPLNKRCARCVTVAPLRAIFLVIKVIMMKMAFDPQILRPIQTSEENVPTGNNRNSLKQLCQDFESIFINSLFQEMRKSIPDGGYLEHDLGKDIFQEMMDMEVAGEMSRKGGLGLGRLLYEQLRDKYDLDKEK
jgi:peptidoglycan hydrolase FlgJ